MSLVEVMANRNIQCENAAPDVPQALRRHWVDSIPALGGSSPYTKEQRAHALATWVVTGNLTRTSEATGVPISTLHGWVQSEWWQEACEKYRKEEGEILDRRITGAMDRALDRVLDGIHDIDARSAATTFGILFDKRQILRHQPTSIRSDSSSLDSLAQRLADLERERRERTIEGERLE